jgi:hypothetical protein
MDAYALSAGHMAEYEQGPVDQSLSINNDVLRNCGGFLPGRSRSRGISFLLFYCRRI